MRNGKREKPLWAQITLGICISGIVLSLMELFTGIGLLAMFGMTLTKTISQPMFMPTPTEATPQKLAESDYPPSEHPSKWDYIKSAEKTCWYHKRNRTKICEPSSN